MSPLNLLLAILLAVTTGPSPDQSLAHRWTWLWSALAAPQPVMTPTIDEDSDDKEEKGEKDDDSDDDDSDDDDSDDDDSDDDDSDDDDSDDDDSDDDDSDDDDSDDDDSDDDDSDDDDSDDDDSDDDDSDDEDSDDEDSDDEDSDDDDSDDDDSDDEDSDDEDSDDEDSDDEREEDAEESDDDEMSNEESESEDESEAEAESMESQPAESAAAATVEGVLESTEVVGIQLDMEEWTPLTVAEVVPHGTEVSAGDVVLKLDVRQVDKALRDLEADVAADQLGLEDAELKLRMARDSSELKLAELRQADEEATQDLKRFLTLERDERVKLAEHSLKSSQNMLEYEREELRQLEKMYAADDLTEETEEIIIRRTRDGVESAEISAENARLARDKVLEIELPRAQLKLELAVRQASLALREGEESAERAIRQQELALEKVRVALQDKQEKLDRLRSERERWEVRAEQSGIVYYGEAKRGVWPEPSAAESALAAGAAVKPKSVLMSIVPPQAQRVRALVAEKDLSKFPAGKACQIKPAAWPDVILQGSVASVSRVPVAPGKFDVVIEYESAEGTELLVPGMTATVEVRNDE
ncbi:MAG: hypothetical protein U0795_07990 [Pirellulales bacterium]